MRIAYSEVGSSEMIRALVMSTVLMLSGVQVVFAQEIDFVEDFVFAKDRRVPLKKLIPGTEDYFYFHCLHLQHRYAGPGWRCEAHPRQLSADLREDSDGENDHP